MSKWKLCKQNHGLLNKCYYFWKIINKNKRLTNPETIKMKHIKCDHCKNDALPMNDSIQIDGYVYCNDCFEILFKDKDSLKDKKIIKELDPTICSNCNLDFNDETLNKISRYPVCKECETKIKNRAFPFWVKAFMSGLMVVVILGFIWNWKYYQAFNNIKKANEYFQRADYSNAYKYMNSASEEVVEVDYIRTMASYFKGIDLLRNDKSGEALVELEKCKGKVESDFNLKSLIIQAQIGICFDKKDYTGFLKSSNENLALDTTQAMSWAGVASAYACLYSQSGNKNLMFQATKYLDKAESIDSTRKELKDYYNMIEYRIYSKQILRREDFTKQFPTGWTKKQIQ